MKRPPFTFARSLLVMAILVGLLVVVLGFDFGRKPRPNTNDDLTGLCISFVGASLVGLSTGLLLRRPKLAAALVFLSPVIYFVLVVAIVWGWVIGRAIWVGLFG
jgi:hypothetical protein